MYQYCIQAMFYMGIMARYSKFLVSLYSDSFLFNPKKGTSKRCLSKFISRFEASQMPFLMLVFFLVEEIYLCLLSIYYVIINEICANKPHRLRRSEAVGGGVDRHTHIHRMIFFKKNTPCCIFY